MIAGAISLQFSFCAAAPSFHSPVTACLRWRDCMAHLWWFFRCPPCTLLPSKHPSRAIFGDLESPIRPVCPAQPGIFGCFGEHALFALAFLRCHSRGRCSLFVDIDVFAWAARCATALHPKTNTHTSTFRPPPTAWSTSDPHPHTHPPPRCLRHSQAEPGATHHKNNCVSPLLSRQSISARGAISSRPTSPAQFFDVEPGPSPLTVRCHKEKRTSQKKTGALESHCHALPHKREKHKSQTPRCALHCFQWRSSTTRRRRAQHGFVEPATRHHKERMVFSEPKAPRRARNTACCFLTSQDLAPSCKGPFEGPSKMSQ